jgi:hypothetical protein
MSLSSFQPSVLRRAARRYRPIFLAAAIQVVAVATVGGVPCREIPELSIARTMLGALPAADQSLREAVVESTLARMPGVGETFLSALMSWEYLTSGWVDPGFGGQPTSLAEGTVYNNRQYGYMYAMPTTVSVSSAGFRTSGQFFTSPLILDLSRDGVPDVIDGAWEPHAGMDLNGPRILFDINGDGFPELTEWVGPSDGLLVAPETASSVGGGASGDLTWTGPLSGRDLLGSAGGYGDGFEKLAGRFDADLDGFVSGAELAGLFIWRDLNQDAVIQPGELVTLQDLSLTALRLPAAGTCVGSFESSSGQGAVWDWWPSYLQGYRVWAPGTAVPPSLAQLTSLSLPRLSYPGTSLTPGADGRISAASLSAAGLDFQTVRMVGLSPSGSWLVMQDRMPGVTNVAAGVVRRLWILPVPGAVGTVIPRIVPVPATDILQFVFADDGTAFLITDNGSRLLKLNLTTGALTQVYEAGDGVAGFRFGPRAFRGAAGVCFSGWFHDAGLASRHESIVSLTTGAGAPTLEEAVDHDLVLAGVASLGVVACEIPVGPQYFHFVVRTTDGNALLVTSRDGVVTVADDNVLASGLAVSGDRVLYFRRTADQSVPEVRVYDAVSGEIQVLGIGDYCYPYLVDGGNVACVASLDWTAGSLTLWKAPVAVGASLQPVVTMTDIGAVRVSTDGQVLACLGPDGLYVGTMTPSDVQSVERRTLQLSQNCPNPFNPQTTIRFELPEAGPARLSVFDVAGRLVRELVEADLSAGSHDVVWDGRDAAGRGVSSGSYLARLEFGGKVETMRMGLVR